MRVLFFDCTSPLEKSRVRGRIESMAFFSSSKKPRSVALIDITSSSVGGAYARVAEGAMTAVYYAIRIPIEAATAEVPQSLMLRTLDSVLIELRSKGAPVLRSHTGSGSVDAVYVSVGAHWQQTSVRTETVVEEKPFVFTDAILAKAKKQGEVPEGYERSQETVLATLLNGYETKEPLGKKAKRAEIIILSADMLEEPAKLMHRALGSFSSHRSVNVTGFPMLAHKAIGLAFPHEKDYLALRVTGEATELVFVNRGFPISVASLSCGLNVFARAARSGGFTSFPDGGNIIDHEKSADLDAGLTAARGSWTAALAEALRTFTATRALPRSLFLLAEPEAREFLRRTLDVPELHALWLSDEPLAVIALEPKQFVSMTGRDETLAEDLPLDLLALYARDEN